MATPDEARFAPDQADLLNHNADPQAAPAEDTAPPPTVASLPNGTTAMQEDTAGPGSPITRPAASPIQSPMRGPTPDTHMNGTEDEMQPQTQPQLQPQPQPQQDQQPAPDMPLQPGPAQPAPLHPQTQHSPPSVAVSQPQAALQSQFNVKDAPSHGPTFTPAPQHPAGSATPASARVPASAPAPAPPEAIPTQMASNQHGSEARVYINSRITPTLLEGMKWVAKHEPEKPLKWLSEFLARRSAQLEGT